MGEYLQHVGWRRKRKVHICTVLLACLVGGPGFVSTRMELSRALCVYSHAISHGYSALAEGPRNSRCKMSKCSFVDSVWSAECSFSC